MLGITLPSLFMDFDGQKRAETLFEVIITASSVAGFAVGYYLQQFSITVIALGVGFLLAALISIPPWPMYRRKPLKWQKHVPLSDSPNSGSTTSGSESVKQQQNPKKASGKSGKKKDN